MKPTDSPEAARRRARNHGEEAVLATLIVGAGFAGIGLGLRLLEQGIEDFVILERASAIGGVWRDNRYPGVACDVPAHLYSYSFVPNPDWTSFFAPQREILAYLERCAERGGLRRKIRLDSEVTRAEFDQTRNLWTVETRSGEAYEARVLVAASGISLSRPVFPDIPGLASFEGDLFHSSRWDEHVSLVGKRIAVIGTGASAIQIIPELVKIASRLHVFQRTAPWVMPRPDRPIGPKRREAFRRRPLLQRIVRGAIWTAMESSAIGFIVDTRINRFRERFVRRFIGRSVADPVLRAKVTPSYTLGCKRVLLSNDYYPSLQKPNVEVVAERIERATGSTLVTADGVAREVDAIVCATGFEAAEAKAPFELVGSGGRSLEEAWRGGVEAYLGCAVSGFPNFFFLVGPNTGLGHNSMIYMIESQIAYVLDALRIMRERGLRRVVLRADVQRAYNEQLQARLERTVWSRGGCTSWYLTPSGKNTTLWPGFTFEFRARTRRFDVESYETA